MMKIKYSAEADIIEFPAQKIKILGLLESKWWEYDIINMEIQGDIPVLEFIDKFYEYRDKKLIKPIVLKSLKEVLEKNNIEYKEVGN